MSSFRREGELYSIPSAVINVQTVTVDQRTASHQSLHYLKALDKAHRVDSYKHLAQYSCNTRDMRGCPSREQYETVREGNDKRVLRTERIFMKSGHVEAGILQQKAP